MRAKKKFTAKFYVNKVMRAHDLFTTEFLAKQGEEVTNIFIYFLTYFFISCTLCCPFMGTPNYGILAFLLKKYFTTLNPLNTRL